MNIACASSTLKSHVYHCMESYEHYTCTQPADIRG